MHRHSVRKHLVDCQAVDWSGCWPLGLSCLWLHWVFFLAASFSLCWALHVCRLQDASTFKSENQHVFPCNVFPRTNLNTDLDSVLDCVPPPKSNNDLFLDYQKTRLTKLLYPSYRCTQEWYCIMFSRPNRHIKLPTKSTFLSYWYWYLCSNLFFNHHLYFPAIQSRQQKMIKYALELINAQCVQMLHTMKVSVIISSFLWANGFYSQIKLPESLTVQITRVHSIPVTGDLFTTLAAQTGTSIMGTVKGNHFFLNHKLHKTKSTSTIKEEKLCKALTNW